MPITTKTFAQWLEPGPAVRTSPKVSTGLSTASWARNVPTGAKTSLIPAIPSTLKTPSPDEWKLTLSDVDWEVVGGTWTTLGRTILARDPWFSFVKNSTYITDEGKFTKTFRDKPWHDRYVTELAERMAEEITFYKELLDVLKRHARKVNASVDIVDDRPTAEEDGEDVRNFGWGWAFRNWGQLAVHGWRVARLPVLFSPQGIGLELVIRGAEYGYTKYREHQRAQDRIERQRRQGVSTSTWPDEPEFNSNGADALLDVTIQGFAPVDRHTYIGCWAVRPDGADDYDPFKLFGAPKYFTGQDGIYL